jgi:cytochrome c oxidase cbb3-type subunit 4
MNLDVNDLRIAATLVSLLLFVSICAWAWARRNHARFAEAALLPFRDEPGLLPLLDEPAPRAPHGRRDA